ncbi:MAG: hypothetical protein JNM63_09575 [Spirochaetia bacterium]|nr:hypothetical protein [Spirochaetia bacterium]
MTIKDRILEEKNFKVKLADIPEGVSVKTGRAISNQFGQPDSVTWFFFEKGKAIGEVNLKKRYGYNSLSLGNTGFKIDGVWALKENLTQWHKIKGNLISFSIESEQTGCIYIFVIDSKYGSWLENGIKIIR